MDLIKELNKETLAREVPAVKIGDTVGGVDNEKDFIGLFDGYLYLFVDFAFKHVFASDYPASGVDDGEFFAYPFHFSVLTVTRGASFIVGDGCAGLCEAVKKG